MTETVLRIKRLAALPPIEAWARVRGALTRRVRAKMERRRDRRKATYLPDTPKAQFAEVFRVRSEDVPPDLVKTLERLCPSYCAHRFDLLGSGPVVVSRSGNADVDGQWLEGRVSVANIKESQRIWRMIGEGPFAPGEYVPIDWHIDFKSGHRWDETAYWRDIRIAPAPGVDIKVPWELSRLQHLPQLAIAAVVNTTQGKPEEAHVYACEVRAQILDFIATVPPRTGVDWASPMETAIRSANMLAAVDILRSADIALDSPFLDVFKRSIFEHTRHVLANLEWSEDARGNHYLANILGVLVAGCCLCDNAETDAWLAFAAGQMGVETKRQFLNDGGSFEASTSYHRLSGEMAMYGAGLVLGARESRSAAFEGADVQALNVRPPVVRLQLGHGIPLDDEWRSTLGRLSEFTYGLQKPDARIPQIGDNDSGRFFLFHPILHPDGRRDHLDHVALLGQAEAVLGRDDLTDGRDVLDTSILKNILFSVVLTPASVEASSGTVSHVGERKMLEDMVSQIQALPTDHRSETVFAAKDDLPTELQATGYPDFGLYVLKGAGTFIAMRCFAPNEAESMGHAHDDNLGMELVLGGCARVTDPGSAIYTADGGKRALYQSAASHFAPRPEGIETARRGAGLFSYYLTGRGECCYFGAHGFAGRIETDAWSVMRAVVVEAHCVRVFDGSVKQPLAAHGALEANHGVSVGYGEETKSPLCLL